MGREDVELMSSDDSSVRFGCEEGEVKSKDRSFHLLLLLFSLKRKLKCVKILKGKKS